MKHRKQLGTRNNIGAKITQLREARKMKQKELYAQMQFRGADINPSSLSKLEGQVRSVTVDEVRVLAEIFEITMEELLK